DPPLYGPRADPRGQGGSPGGRLLLRGHDLRAAYPAAPVPGNDPGGDPGQAPEGGPAADADVGPRPFPGPGRPGVEDAGQGPGGADAGHEGGAPGTSEVGAPGHGGPGPPGGPPAPAEAKMNPAAAPGGGRRQFLVDLDSGIR